MDLLITNARLIDGTGSPPRSPCSIRVRAGRIAEIGSRLHAAGETQIDASDATLLPGLIDPHVHLQSVPGAYWRKDDGGQLRRARFHHLRAYLACGVTTVLDAAIAAPVLREVRSYLASGGPGPTVYALAPAFYPPDGYLDNNYLTDQWGPMWRSTRTSADIRALFEEYEGIPNIIGVKAFIEYGFSPFYNWPIHTQEMRDLIKREANARGLPIFVHSIEHRAHEIALDMEPRALVHSGFSDRQPSVEFIDRMKDSGTWMMSTLSSLFDCLLARTHFVAGIDDPLILLTVPKEQLETAQDPSVWRSLWRHLFRSFAPGWMPSGLVGAASWFLRPAFCEAANRRYFHAACRAISNLHASGVRIVMGTDSGAWPLFPACFHGYSTLREMELLAIAGLPPMTVLQAATRLPAEMLGLDGEIGTVEVGKRADLVVVADDPLSDLRALRSIQWTIKGGVARTPEEWMAEKAAREDQI